MLLTSKHRSIENFETGKRVEIIDGPMVGMQGELISNTRQK